MGHSVLAYLIMAGLLGMAGCSRFGGDGDQLDYYLDNITVIRGDGTTPFLADVAIQAGRIRRILDPDGSPDAAAELIDGRDKFLIPGLWDMHVHLAADVDDSTALGALLEAGVTNVRDAGGYLPRIMALNASVESGTRMGPNIYFVGPTLNGEAFTGFQVALNNPEDAREQVRKLDSIGVDAIKVHRAISAEILKAVAEEAHRLGLKVSGHIPLGNPPDLACSGYLDSVEHLGSFLEAYISVSEGGTATMGGAFSYFLSADATPLYECLSRTGVYVTPTAVIYPYIAKQMGPEMAALGQQTVAAVQRILGRFREYGIPLMSGTDAPLSETNIPYGSSVVEELEILGGAGFSTQDLLRVATENPARFMGVYDVVGSVAEGKRADLVVLTADPLESISNLRAVEAVFVGGKRVR